jgi:hypothetical protein
MTEDFGDTYDGEIPGIYDSVAAGGTHFFSTDPEKFE